MGEGVHNLDDSCQGASYSGAGIPELLVFIEISGLSILQFCGRAEVKVSASDV